MAAPEAGAAAIAAAIVVYTAADKAGLVYVPDFATTYTMSGAELPPPDGPAEADATRMATLVPDPFVVTKYKFEVVPP